MAIGAPQQRLAIDASSMNQLKREAAGDPQKALKATSQQFEGFMLAQMIKTMRESVPKSGLMGEAQGGQQMDTYQSMLDQQLGMTLSSKGMGLANMLTKHLSRDQKFKASVSPLDQAAAPMGTLASPLAGVAAMSSSAISPLSQLNVLAAQRISAIAEPGQPLDQFSGVLQPSIDSAGAEEQWIGKHATAEDIKFDPLTGRSIGKLA